MADAIAVGQLRDWAVRLMDNVPRSEAVRDADLILGHVLGLGRAELIAYPDRHVVSEDAAKFRSFVAERLAGVPLQYVLGWADFYGLRFEVSPAVLIPRPETEVLVDQVLNEIARIDNPSVLDVGTGSGCIAVAVAHERPDARVFAVDVSHAAIRVAMRNAERNGVQVSFMTADLRDEAFEARESTFDVVVSNPPYVHPNEMDLIGRHIVEHEPHVALFTGDDSLEYYRLLLARTLSQIRTGGALIVEVHAERATQVKLMMSESASITGVHIVTDLAGRERVVRASVGS